MKKKNVEIMCGINKINGRRLNLDKKQNIFPLPSIVLREENYQNEQQKVNKQMKNEVKQIKSFAIREKHVTVVPFLMKRFNTSSKNLGNYDKTRSQSEGLQSEKHGKVQYEALRGKILAKLKQQQKPKTLYLDVEQKKWQKQSGILVNGDGAGYEEKRQNFTVGVVNGKNGVREKVTQKTLTRVDSGKGQKKECVSVGVLTDLSMTGESYKQFIKFKVTQKQKFTKLQQVFTFIDNISSTQSSTFNSRYQNTINLLSQPMQNQRQRQILQLVRNIQQVQNEFKEKIDLVLEGLRGDGRVMFEQERGEVGLVKEELLKVRKLVGKVVGKKGEGHFQDNREGELSIDRTVGEPLSLKYLNDDSSDRQRRQPQLKPHNTLSNRINKALKLIYSLQQKIKQNLQSTQQNIVRTRLQLYRGFNKTLQTFSQRDYIIRVCVEDILRLPEMSLTIFGMDQGRQIDEEQELMRRIGVAIDEVPGLEEFFLENKGKQGGKCENGCMDGAFRQMVDVKCLNCAYLKSKMKFVYKKNVQLRSVVKILNYLVQQKL